MRGLLITVGASLGLAACAGAPAVEDDMYEVLLEPTLPVLRADEPEIPFSGMDLPERGGAEPSSSVDVAEPKPETTASPISDETTYALDLRGVPVAEAVHLIAAKAGVNVYLDAGLDMPVDASFPAVTLDQALGVILSRHGLVLAEEPPGVYWVERRDGSQTETRMIRLESIHASEVAEHLEALIGESVELVVDANQNLVLMRGPGADIELAEAYLDEADRLRAQVLIEVEILEISLDDSFQLGIQAALSDNDIVEDVFGGIDLDLSTGAEDFTAVFTHGTKSISAVVNALSEFGVVNVVSSPRVLAVTNTEAVIEVVTEVPYIDTQTQLETDPSGTGVTSQETVEFKEVGVKLTVTPIVQEGGVVNMVINQEFSEVVDFFLGIPVVDTRKVMSNFLVNESDTAMIGGLIQDRQTEIDRGVPILMHVPLVGRLFRSDEDTMGRRELIVLMRPRLADPDEAARLGREYHDSYIDRVRASGLLEEREGAKSE